MVAPRIKEVSKFDIYRKLASPTPPTPDLAHDAAARQFSQVADQRRGAADRGQTRQALGVVLKQREGRQMAAL